ncbi:MAG: hypothetical protein ACI9HK_004312 [Pirellulaceae bacterium]|jgi:hypothetical protein
MDATGVPLCGGGGESLLPSGDSEGLVVVPVVAQAGGSVGEHGQGSCQALTHAGAVQAVLDNQTALAFDDAAGGRVALKQVLAVTHAGAIVLEVSDGRLDCAARCFAQSTFLPVTAFL